MIAPQALSQDTSRSAEVCAVTPQTQVYSNAHVFEESGDLNGWDMEVVEQRGSTAKLTLYTYEGRLTMRLFV